MTWTVAGVPPKRAAAVVAAALVIAIPAVTVGARPAAAASTTCSAQSANPSQFHGIFETELSKPLSNRTIKLVSDYEMNKTYGWATISGPTAGSDRVWLDVSNNSGATHVQCGPFSVDDAGTIGFTRAEPADLSNPARRFRACGDILKDGKRTHACTGWW
jgi:hypothetical protein